jgi:AcrR family transcriptional regulator
MNSPNTGSATGTPLRERHKQYTRGLIFEALAVIIAKDGIYNFSVQHVADRAGVSHRTVYRHFPSREALINDFSDWLNQSMLERGAISEVSSTDEIAMAAEVNFSLWDEYPALMSEMAKTYFVTGLRLDDRDRRTQAFRALMTEAAPNADPQDVQRAFMIIRCLASSLTWTFFREQLDVDGREAGQAVAWAINTLIRDLKDRNTKVEQGGTTHNDCD